jgi:hypothetical protein
LCNLFDFTPKGLFRQRPKNGGHTRALWLLAAYLATSALLSLFSSQNIYQLTLKIFSIIFGAGNSYFFGPVGCQFREGAHGRGGWAAQGAGEGRGRREVGLKGQKPLLISGSLATRAKGCRDLRPLIPVLGILAWGV